MNVRRMIGSVAEMLDDSIDPAENEQQLDRGGEGKAADRAAAPQPSGARFDGERRCIVRVEPPLDRCVPRLALLGRAEERAFHRAEHENQLADDAGSKRATGHGTVPSLLVFPLSRAPVKPRKIWPALLALLPFLALGMRSSAFAESTSAADVDRFLERLARASASIHDYVCTFEKQERIDGELMPASTILLKQRRDPRCIYMKWTAGPDRGREAIHCPAKYGGDLKVHEGSGITSWITLSLDPKGSVAMDGERHPITEAGIFFTIERFVERVRADRSRLRFEQPKGPDCLTVTQAEPTGSYAYRTEVCLESGHSLPASVEIWDAGGALLERYVYSDYRIDVGASDREFDIANPEYGF